MLALRQSGSSLRRSLFNAAGAFALTGCALLALPTSAKAQGAAQDSGAVGEIVVTGSRIVRDGYTAPTPTTVLGTQELQQGAPVVVSDLLNRLPQMGGGTSPRTTGAGIAGGTGGANFLNTRNLGASRTLVLLDGRRVVPATTQAAVDINSLPSSLVERVDVVTGGASAAYGSDAVAGVVNFILDKDFSGVKGSAQFGRTFQGDGNIYSVDLAAGTSFAGGRGHLLLSGEYSKQEGIYRADSRDWYQGNKSLPNPAYTPTNGQPGRLIYPNVGLQQATHGGLIVSGPLRGYMFGPGGALQTMQFSPILSGQLMGGGGTPTDIAGEQWLSVPVERGSVFVRASFDITSDITAYAEGIFGKTDTSNGSSPYVRHGNITIRSDNPYIPAGLPMTGVTSFSLGRTNDDLGRPIGVNERDMFRWVAGLEGPLPMNGRWDAYYQYGKSLITNSVINNPNVSNYDRAVDVIRNPAVGGVAGVAVGAPICRSLLTNPTNGCQPLNVFGFGSPSQAAINYVNGRAYAHVTLRQDVAAVSGQFEPFSTWAGPVSTAAGFEYRKESYVTVADPVSNAAPAPFWLGNYKSGSGEYSVDELFVEAIVPLARDQAFAKALEVNAAARTTNYSTSGRVTTWKLGLTYDINEDLRLRGTRSRDIRAPNLNDMFLGGQVASQSVLDALRPGNPSVFISASSGGNPNLAPERADTLAFGAVYRPSWLSGLNASIDYFDIRIDGAIASLSAAATVNACYGLGVTPNPSLCSQITPAGPGTLAGAIVRTGPVNVDTLETSGLDFEVSYRTDLDRFFSGAPGRVDLRAVVTNVRKQQTVRAGVVENNLGVDPKWRGLFTASYEIGPSRTSLSVNHVGATVYGNEPIGSAIYVADNQIEGRTYFDLSTNYRMEVNGIRFTVFGVIENLLDADPPVQAPAAGNNQTSLGIRSDYFDRVGRSFRLGLRFQR